MNKMTEKEKELAVEVLLRYYEEQEEMIRHLENQRATFMNMMIVVSVGVIGFVVQQRLSHSSIPLTIMLIVIGIYDWIAVEKFYERYHLHRIHTEKWLTQINHLVPHAQLNNSHKEAVEQHNARYRVLSKLHTHTVWNIFNILIIIAGVLLTLYSLV
jgi:hypothetical protein